MYLEREDSSTPVTAFSTLGIGSLSNFLMLEAIQTQRRRQQSDKSQRYALACDRGRFIPFTISARLVAVIDRRCRRVIHNQAGDSFRRGKRLEEKFAKGYH